jgi:PAS domain S-box-containing protein
LVNAAAERLLGYSRAELLRMGPPDILEPGQLPQLAEARRVFEETGSWRGQWRLRRKDGGVVIAEATNGRHVIDGRVLYQGFFRDVTERVRIEEALARQESQLAQAHAALQEAHAQLGAKARLEGVALAARALAHLLGNDLAVPVGEVDILREEPGLPPPVAASLATIAAGLDAATRHVEQFQTVVRVAIKDTPVGPSLDLDRSTCRDSPST